MAKTLPDKQGSQVRSLGQEDPLEKEISPPQYSCRENPWTEESGGHSPWGHAESDTAENTSTHTCSKRMGGEETEAGSETNLLKTFDPTEKRDAGAGVKYGASGSLGLGCVCF